MNFPKLNTDLTVTKINVKSISNKIMDSISMFMYII